MFNGGDTDDVASRRRRVHLDGRSTPAVAIRKRINGYKSALGTAKITPLLQQKLTELAQIEVIASALRACSQKNESERIPLKGEC
jgi:hypothetical protein